MAVPQEEDEATDHPGKWRWHIQRGRDGLYTISNGERQHGALACSTAEATDAGDRKILYSLVDKNGRDPGRWRWSIECDETTGLHKLSNANLGGLPSLPVRIAACLRMCCMPLTMRSSHWCCAILLGQEHYS